jgi:hypothetical protein
MLQDMHQDRAGIKNSPALKLQGFINVDTNRRLLQHSLLMPV